MFASKPMIIYFVLHDDEIVYIGQTKLSLRKRQTQHEYNAKRGKGYIIGAAIRKHGAASFKWHVHSTYFNQQDLDAAEKHYIAKYKPRYNINLGGEARGVRKNKGSTPWNKGLKGSTPWNKGHKETRPEVLAKIKEGAKNKVVCKERKITSEQRTAMVEGRRERYKQDRPAKSVTRRAKFII